MYFSFIHKNPGNAGFEQAHVYQHLESIFKDMYVDSTTRNFNFAHVLTNLFIVQSIYPTSGLEDADFSISVNGKSISASACVGSSIIFNVFDPGTFNPIPNTTNPYGAASPCGPSRVNNFEFSTQSANWRDSARLFLENYVKNGYYVVARKIYDLGGYDWAPTVWAADTALYGHNNSLYHALKAQGTLIDSFNKPRTFVLIFKKNDSTHFSPQSYFTKGIYDRITLSENMNTNDTAGYVFLTAIWAG